MWSIYVNMYLFICYKNDISLCLSVIQNVIELQPKPYYLLAVDYSNNTMEDVVKVCVATDQEIVCQKSETCPYEWIEDVSLNQTLRCRSYLELYCFTQTNRFDYRYYL